MLMILKRGRGQSKWIVKDEFGNSVCFRNKVLCGPTKEQCEWKAMSLLEELISENGWEKKKPEIDPSSTTIYRGTLDWRTKKCT